MDITFRRAAHEDIDGIVLVGRTARSFAVSADILFYERAELEEWIADSRHNHLYVACAGTSIIGFLYCKRMSYHWAVLDNFYVDSSYRMRGIGAGLLQALLEELRRRGISYLTCLTDVRDAALADIVAKLGFMRAKSYVWHELFLDRPKT